MKGKTNSKKSSKVKNFFSGLVVKLDKKMKEKAKSSKCGCDSNSGESSCCS